MAKTQADLLHEFAAEVMYYQRDPLGFVRAMYPWGEGELSGATGPRSWQAAVLDDIGTRLRRGYEPGQAMMPVLKAVASGHGVGKALGHGEPVLTPFGWRPIESLSVGEQVISVDGTATVIVGVFRQGERDLFRVTTDDGCSVVVDGDHLWFTTNRTERKHGYVGNVRTTREIAESLTFPNGPRDGLNHCIPTCEAAQHPTAALPVEPYALGCWLGNGHRGSGTLTHGSVEQFDLMAAAGSQIRYRAQETRSHAVCATSLGMFAGLRLLGLIDLGSHERFVPKVYLNSDIFQRIALLQGLLDTDGSCGKHGAVTFEVTSKPLADGVSELVRSLGGLVRRSEKIGAYGGKVCRRVYRVFIALPRGISPFRLPRKAGRYKPEWGARDCDRTRRRFVRFVEPVGRGQATCIAVAHPSSLYITRDHIVTHNTGIHAWLGWWALSTCAHTKVRTTANTATQLKSTSVPEAAKWAALALNRDWFKVDGMQIVATDPRHRLTWRWDFVTWSPTNTEAFAGLHNKGRRVVMMFDEASGIAPPIWAPAEGVLTDEDTEIIWLAAGNPTQPEGKFFECFGKERHRWHGVQIDSRDVEGTNKALLEEWIASYGEDSDFARVRVRGIFPRAGVRQFISRELADNAALNEPIPLPSDPLLIGVDVARSGNAQSVICVRKGRDARSWPWKKFRGIDTMQLASVTAEMARELGADAVFVDEGGMGAGVVDRLRQLNVPVIGVQFGGKASRTAVGGNPSLARVKYANKRAEMWGFMREWLEAGAIPDDEELLSDLAGPQYGFNARDEIQLERKEDMEKRGLASPDVADALCTTFAEPVEKALDGRMGVAGLANQRVVADYDAFAVLG